MYRDDKIDPKSWRICIRQADMLIRRARDQADANHVGKSGRRRPGRSPLSIAFEQLADQVWNTLNDPPATVGDAYDFDHEIERSWPGVGMKENPERARSGS